MTQVEAIEITTPKHDMCQMGKNLRLAYFGDPSRKQAYEAHVNACPDCQAHFAELTAAAQNAVHPEVTE